MDPKGNNPYNTEIPVEEAEKELLGPSLTLPNSSPPINPSTPPQQPPPPVATPSYGPTPPPPPRSLSDKASLIPKIVVGVLVLLIILLSGYIITARMGTTKTPQKVSVTPTQIPTPTILPTATPTPGVATESANPTSNRFHSQTLGIYFDYAKSLPDSQNQTVAVETDSSRVYVFTSGTTPSNGQYVDVMSKLTTDSTLQAVSKVTMSDPNYAGCTFSYKAQTPYPATYEEIIPTCPSKNGAGLTFFLGDSTHPNMLLFVSIGQYAIPSSSDPQVTWQDTLRFL